MSEIADFYVTLRGVSAPIVSAYAQVAEAGEAMAAKILAANERIILSNRAVEESAAKLATAASASAPAMTEATVAASTAVETAAVKTVEANNLLISSNAELAASIGSASVEWRTSYAAMAATTAELSAGMEMANVRAAASAEAMGARIDAVAASTTATSVGRMAAVQKGVLLAGAAAAIASAALVHMAGDFESSTQRLVSSAGETQANLGMVRDGILAMAPEVGNTSAELAKAMYIIESGGQHAADGLKVLRAAAEGAKTEGAALVPVADAITSILQDYHLAADQSALVTSKLVAAVGAGKTTFQDFTSSLSAILPIASSAKISLDDILGALASMTVHGMSAAQASQNMADAVKHMLAPTQVQAKELGQLGMSAQDLAGMLSEKGLTGTVNTLTDAILKHMGPSGKVMLDAFNQSKDAAGAVKTMIASMPAGLHKLADEYVAGSISAKEWTAAVKKLPTDQAELAKQFASLQDRARGFSDALKSGSPAAQSYQDALRRVMGDATGLNVALMLTGENTAYVTDAVRKVTAATTEADGSVRGWHDIQGTFNQRMSEAKAGLESLGVSIGQKLLPVASMLMDGIAKITGWFSRNQWAATALAVVIGVVLVAALIMATKVVIGFTIALLTNPAVLITMAIIALIVAIVYLAMHWKQVWAAIVTAAKAAWSAITGIFDGIGRFFAAIPGEILDALSGLGSMLAGLAKKAWDAFTNGLKAATRATLQFLKNLPHEIGFALGFLAGMLVKLAIDGWNGFTKGIKIAFVATVQWFKDLPGNIWDFLKNADQWIKEGGHKLLVGFWNGIVEGFKKTVQFFKDLPGNIWDFLKNADQWSKEGGHKLLVGFLDGIVNAAEHVWQWLKDLPGNIVSFLGDAGKWLLEVGKNIVRGLWNGITSMGGWLKSQVSSFAGGIIDGFKSGFGVFSPSKLTHEIGGHLVTGLADGITSQTHRAVTAMHGLTSSVMAAAGGLHMPEIGHVTVAQAGRPMGIPGGGLPGISDVGRTGAGATRIGPVIPAAGQAGQGQTVNQFTINVAGQVVTWKQLVTEIQQALLRHNSRNVNNGASGNIFVTT